MIVRVHTNITSAFDFAYKQINILERHDATSFGIVVSFLRSVFFLYSLRDPKHHTAKPNDAAANHQIQRQICPGVGDLKRTFHERTHRNRFHAGIDQIICHAARHSCRGKNGTKQKRQKPKHKRKQCRPCHVKRCYFVTKLMINKTK